jgi:hypothetical protein
MVGKMAIKADLQLDRKRSTLLGEKRLLRQNQGLSDVSIYFHLKFCIPVIRADLTLSGRHTLFLERKNKQFSLACLNL